MTDLSSFISKQFVKRRVRNEVMRFLFFNHFATEVVLFGKLGGNEVFVL